jgi:hypothetical protein
MTVHRVGEKAENQRKTREKSKVAETQVFWLDFCAKKRTVHTPSRQQQRKARKRGGAADKKKKSAKSDSKVSKNTNLLKPSRIYFDNPSSSRDKTIFGALFHLLQFADFPHQIIVDLLHIKLAPLISLPVRNNIYT